MHPSRATPRSINLSRSPRSFVYAVLVALLGALGAGAVTAQGTPSIAVDSFTYLEGAAMTLTGRGLEPNAVYTVTLTPPAGSGAEARVSEARASSFGNLSRRETLDAQGTWTVELVGPGMNAQLRIEVEPDPAAPREEPPTPEQPVTDEPADESPSSAESAPPAGETPSAAQEGPSTQVQPPANGGLPQPTTPPVTPPVSSGATPSVSIVGTDVVAILQGREVWRLGFGADSGGTSGLLQLEEGVLVGHGNHVLVIDPVTGVVAARHRMPARVANIERSVGAVGADGTVTEIVEVVVVHGDGSARRLPLTIGQPDRDVVFDPDPDLYRWLRAEAIVADPNAALAKDPTNPWLYVAAAQLSDQTRAEVLRRGAMSQAQTFYEYAQLANEFMLPAHRNPELANQAMEAALNDFTRRGYRSSMLFEEEASGWYGFPLSSMRTALTRDDSQAADFWAPWLYRMASTHVPATNALLGDYARDLRAAGRQEEARVWSERAGETERFSIPSAVRRAAESLGRTGWYGVGALLVAILALHLTLSAKYWRAQSLVLSQRRQAGGSVGPAARLFTLRYATFTEKVVVILLFAAVLALASLTGWVARSDGLPSRLGTGTLATPVAQESLRTEFPATASAAFAKGFAAQMTGDVDTATVHYRDLTTDADAMNNLGVIRADPELFRLALELSPGHPEATFNLGLGPNPSRLLSTYLPDEPVLATPDRERLGVAWAGDFGESLGAAFTNPWTSLTELRALQPQWLWIAVVIVFLAWVAFTVITLLIPRPAAARNAPRTFLYHLLALLLPGSGLADELWGVLLLVPWAIFGIDFALHYLPTQAATSFTLQTDTIALIVIYVINTIAFVVEFLSYRRRMRSLRSEQPAAAAAYGLNGS